MTETVVNPAGETIFQYLFDADDPEGMLWYRWDPVVYPSETSMVFFIGWGFAEVGLDDMPGVYKFTYALSVTFEGETFDLVRTVNIIEIA